MYRVILFLPKSNRNEWQGLDDSVRCKCSDYKKCYVINKEKTVSDSDER